jgi:hypothetical protein
MFEAGDVACGRDSVGNLYGGVLADVDPSPRHFKPNCDRVYIHSARRLLKPLGLGISMSSHNNRLDTVTDARLSAVAEATANLMAQLSELKELRERVRKAELSTRNSRRN